MSHAVRGIFHYTTEGMVIPPNVRKVQVDSSSLQRLPRGAFSEQARMYQVDFVSSSSSSDNNNHHQNHHSTLVEIGDSAFYKCRILASFHPPMTVRVIGANALCGCASLMNVTLPNRLQRLQHRTFAYCKLLESIRIPGSVQVIGSEAFLECKSLTNVVFDGKEDGCQMRIIEDRAFAGCVFLGSIAIPSTLEIIGNKVFEGCRCLGHANLAPPQGRLKSIGTEAFCQLERFEKVYLPDSLETIGDGAFRSCKHLYDVIIVLSTSSGMTVMAEATTITDHTDSRVAQMPVRASATAGNTLFRVGDIHIRRNNTDPRRLCVGLRQLKACTRLVSVGDGCFQGCFMLGSVSIPPSMETLSKSILERVTDLVHVELPEGLRIIQAHALERCFFLRAIKIPSTVTTIEEKAFLLCVSLVSVGIPKNLQRLGAEAFRDCASLLNLWLPPQVASSLLSSRRAINGPLDTLFAGCTQLISKYGGEDQSQIVQGLTDRFQERPIHELCYFSNNEDNEQATSTLDNYLLQSSTLTATASSSDYSRQLMVDPFGMTPCHILASSANLRMDLFQALMNTHPVIPLLCTMDHAGNYVLDYLYTNTYSSNAPHQLEQLVLEMTLDRRIRQLGRQSWRTRVEEACSSSSSRPRRWLKRNHQSPRTPDAFHQALYHAYQLLEGYEQKEMAVLLELIVWKRALMTTSTGNTKNDVPITITTISSPPEHREYSRVKSGADAVMDSVMPFVITTT